MTGYPRDLVGYADQPPDPRWPGGARLALNFVINYEEGGERSVLHGDKVAETRLTDPLVSFLTPDFSRTERQGRSQGAHASFMRGREPS